MRLFPSNVIGHIFTITKIPEEVLCALQKSKKLRSLKTKFDVQYFFCGIFGQILKQ